MSDYVAGSTGYKPGRPRKGEVRPLSPNAEKMRKYRARRLERDPEWRIELAAKQRAWYHKNHERAIEIQRGVAQRAKAWKQAHHLRHGDDVGMTITITTLK